MKRRATATAALLTAALVLAIAAVALAAFPQDPPNDPGYAPAEGTPDKCATKSADEQDHYLFGFMPQCTQLTATDPENAAGMSVDRAWKDFTTGRGDTVIAYVEGGINWHNGDAPELANRVFLNKGELPPPTTDNHDGTLSALDYADTPDVNKNGIVDPEDIIKRYSDGRDGDHNGYTDDISGWDFYDDQNDPATVDSAYGHANGQQKQAAAEGNNGIGEIGVCPSCMVMPVKAGAEALDRTDDLAQAWLYASDMKADVIVSVTADLGYSSFMRQAVERIWRRGRTVMVEASNDFDSTDHQGGMFWPHVLPGNGMVANSHGVPGPAANALTKTYRARSGLTSWGTHNMFTAATTGGSTSESTPTVGGVMALVLAYGKTAAEQGKIARPLTNAEAVQVVRATASDSPGGPNDPWPARPGWDLQYGYGRPNVHKAMEAISRGDIPPVAWFRKPDWYSLYDPTRTKTLRVTGHIAAPRSSGFTSKLEFAPGAEPAESDFIEAKRAIHSGVAVDGTLGFINLRKVPKSFWSKAFEQSKTKVLETNEQYTVTLRLRVTDAQGRVGEERRTIAVHHDPSLLHGFPKRIGPSIEGEPVLADLQGRGHLAAIFGDADGRVHALDGKTGRELRGWPAKLNATQVTRRHAGIKPGAEPVISNPAVGDLDHNGRLSVVVTSTTGRVYVFGAYGQRRRGWPKRMRTGVAKPPIPRPEMPYTRLPQQGASSPPLLQDLDGDGKLEVVQGGWDGRLYAWHPNGRRAKGWPVEVKLPAGHQPPSGNFVIDDHKIDTAPAVADLDGDGKPELVVRSQYTDVPAGGITPGGVAHLHAYHGDGTPVAGFPVEMKGLVEYYGSAQEFITEGTHAPSSADVDGDGNDEVAASPIFTPPSLIDGDGSTRATYGSAGKAAAAFLGVQGNPAGVIGGDVPDDEPVTFTTSGAFGKLGGGALQYAQPQTGGASIAAALLTAGSGAPIRNYLTANDAQSGAPATGFPTEIQGLDFLGAPLVADVSGDGKPDLLTGADSSAMHAFDSSGASVPGFPKFTTGWTVWAPSTGDLRGNGRTALVSTTREGYVMAWSTAGRAAAGNDEWWSYRHDERNTARYGVDTRPPGVARRARLSIDGGRLTFRAPGDDWYAGRVAKYRVRYRGKTRTVKATAGAGKRERIKVPATVPRVTLQAVDDAGNLGRALTVYRPVPPAPGLRRGNR